MPYIFLALISVIIFASIHLWADKTKYSNEGVRSKFLSMGEGVAIAYVFIALLPKLAQSDLLLRQKLLSFFPYFEKHVYVLALFGFLLFFVVGKSKEFLKGKGAFLLALASYALFNFLVGYAVVDKNNPEVKPLLLFTFAMGLHYFSNDFSLTQEHGDEYRRYGKWILIVCLFAGWIAGALMTLSVMAISLVSAFIGGGMIVNIMKHEFSGEKQHNLAVFVLASIVYMWILLLVGK